jgi:hypothetical protein
MATRAQNAPVTLNGGAILFSWSGLLVNDDGAALAVPWFAEKTVHVKGTFGAGGTAKIQFTNDGATAATFGALTACLARSPDSVAISITGEDGKIILENPVWLRPIITAGDGTTNLQCFIVCRPAARGSY